MFGAKEMKPNRAQWIEVSQLRAEIERVRNGGRDHAVKVRRKSSALAAFPFKGLIYLFLGLAMFKAIALAQLGGEGYEARLDKLREGTIVEQAGAWVMQPEPATLWIAAIVAPYIR